MRLDVAFAVVGQAHQARLDRLAAAAHAEVAVGLALHVGEGGQLGKLLLPPRRRLVVHVGQVTPQHGPRREGGTALRAGVHPHVVKLVPVDLDAVQAVGIATREGDCISQRVCTQGAVKPRGQREARLRHVGQTWVHRFS